MKLLKILLGILAFLLVVYLILCIAGPKRMEDLTRTTEMNAAAPVVYSQIADLKNWEKWSPWYKRDPGMEITYSDKTQGVGAKYTWTSEESGAGSLEIVEAVPPKSMKTKLLFDGFDGHANGLWNVEPLDGGKTNVSWGFHSEADVPFPFRGMMLLSDPSATLVKDFDEGLANLKEVCEKIPAVPEEIKSFNLNGVKYYGIRDRIQWADIEKFYMTNFPKLAQYLETSGTKSTGQPRGIYYEWDEENKETDMAAAIPVSAIPSMGEAKEKIKIVGHEATLYGNNVLVCDYYGGYHSIGPVHEAIGEWIAKEGKEQLSPVMEEYVTDPGEEPDSTKWLTRVYYAFK